MTDHPEQPLPLTKPWRSVAVWPPEVGIAESDDFHYTHDEAAAVCRMLSKHGFGGDRKYFPLSTRVELRTRAAQPVAEPSTRKEGATIRKCEKCKGNGPCLYDDTQQRYLCVQCHSDPHQPFFREVVRSPIPAPVTREELTLTKPQYTTTGLANLQNQLRLVVNGNQVGVLHFTDPLRFEGNVDESAKLFIEHVIEKMRPATQPPAPRDYEALARETAKTILQYCAQIRCNGSYPDPDAHGLILSAIHQATEPLVKERDGHKDTADMRSGQILNLREQVARLTAELAEVKKENGLLREQFPADFRDVSWMLLSIYAEFHNMVEHARNVRKNYPTQGHFCDFRKIVDSICDREPSTIQTLRHCSKIYQTLELRKLDQLRADLSTAQARIVELERATQHAWTVISGAGMTGIVVDKETGTTIGQVLQPTQEPK